MLANPGLQALVAAPHILRFLGLPSTPLNTGKLKVSDYDGVVDCTTGMQAFLDAGIANGDEMKLPAIGVKAKISTTLNLEGDGKNFAGLRGSGQRSILAFVAGNFHKFRIALTDEFHPKMPIENLYIESGTVTDGEFVGTLPSDGKAAFALDGTQGAIIRNIGGVGHDILFYPYNNSYNHVVDGLSSPRFDANRVGVYVPVGSGGSGSDNRYSNTFLFCKDRPFIINGGGGHYLLDFGQWGAQASFTAAVDGGMVDVCRGYAGDSNIGGATAITMHSIAMEGWKGLHAIRTFEQCSLALLGCTFTPTVSTAGQQAVSMLKMTAAGNSRLLFMNNEIGQGYFANAALCSIAGATDFFHMDEFGWFGAQGTVINGVTMGSHWLHNLQLTDTGWAGYQTGISAYIDETASHNYPVMALGLARLRWNWNSSELQKSVDGGANWADIQT